MACNVVSLYRKHVTSTTTDKGRVTPTRTTDGPYAVGIVPTKDVAERTEKGIGKTSAVSLGLSVSRVFASGDILNDGTKDVYRVGAVRTYPDEQQMELISLVRVRRRQEAPRQARRHLRCHRVECRPEDLRRDEGRRR